jgi:hypothetical protein
LHSCTFNAGSEHIKPKHHWALDVPDQLVRDGVLVDAFIIERRHLFIKHAAEPVDNTSNYEESVIAASTGLALSEARKAAPVVPHGLIGARKKLSGMDCSRQLEAYGFSITIGDVVANAGAKWGIVRACVADDNGLGVIVNEMLVVAASPRSKQGSFRDELQVWRARDLQLCVAWRCLPDGKVEVLHR